MKLLVFGDDNGSCSLYKMTLKEYEAARTKADESDDWDAVYEAEIESKKIADYRPRKTSLAR